MKANPYKLVFLCTTETICRVIEFYHIFMQYLNPIGIVVIAKNDVLNFLKDEQDLTIEFIDEDKLYPHMNYKSIQGLLEDVNGATTKRVGWYFQQFLKMAYSKVCCEDWYLVWDSDTIPTHEIRMFSENDIDRAPYFDVKTEYFKSYFDTISNIFPELKKEVDYSFVSEHMLINTEVMNEIINKIESDGRKFWINIIYSINKDSIDNAGFSEFETYGTYVTHYYPNMYKIRKWHSLRTGTVFFGGYIEGKKLTELAVVYDAVSFENHYKHLKYSKIFNRRIFRSYLFIYLLDTVIFSIKKRRKKWIK